MKRDVSLQVGSCASGLSWIWTLTPMTPTRNYQQTTASAPKDERPTLDSTSAAVLSLPPSSGPPHRRVVHQRTVWQLHPSAWHKIKELVGRKGRRGRGQVGGRSILLGKWFQVMFDNEQQVFWGGNVPWPHLHVSLGHIWIFLGEATATLSSMYKQRRNGTLLPFQCNNCRDT